MLAYPKLEHVTLPSVETVNILRDPPKGIYTRKIDKVGQTSEITEEIGDSGNRICDVIKLYPRGIDPMKTINFSNNGTSGGQVRYRGGSLTANGGITSSFGSGGTKFPYRVVRDGAFRPPIWTPQDLLPLSRLPRAWTYAATNPGFPDFQRRNDCYNKRIIKEETINTCVRPTAVYNIQVPLTSAPFELRQIIENPLKYSTTSGVRTLDILNVENVSPTSGVIVEDKVYESVTSNPGSNKSLVYGEAIIPVENFINEDISKGSYTSTPFFEKEDRNISDNIYLQNKTPLTEAYTNISDMTKYRNIESETIKELDRNVPCYSAVSNVSNIQGTQLMNTNYNLHPKISKGGFEGKGIMPKEDREDYEYISLNQEKSIRTKAYEQFSSRYQN